MSGIVFRDDSAVLVGVSGSHTVQLTIAEYVADP